MKRSTLPMLLLYLATAGIPACGGEDDWFCDSRCLLDTGSVEVPQAVEIRYEAYAVGDGVFSSIEYLDNSEPEQVWRNVEEDPIHVPWAWSALYRPGMQLRIRGAGQLENGSLRVWFFQPDDPEGLTGSDTCEWVCSMFR